VRGGSVSSVSGSPSGPMTCAGRIFWFSIIITSKYPFRVVATGLASLPLPQAS
jgi:hypothetical protein